MMSDKGSKKEKNQNIQVFVRLRPLNQRERDIKSLGVVEVVNGREVVVRQSQNTSHTKKFTFDRAFGPQAKQVEVYQEVVSPLIEEVLAGYNCTVFAYGQTGTGKTHTMVGESMGGDTNWQNDPLAGIVPRALSQLFDELRLTNTEYTVRVSYLELYNEELFDLLASSEDSSKLRIYEDASRKGANIVNGLEEVTVYNKNEVYKIMAQGQERKKVASTLMNAQSSRSHTVFTIVVHMKENSPEGEELVKVGKLNLVDLAGSENISKAGSDNPAKRERARECVNINQSLLTLGRVITALVERHPHIPYRESKLTRILQESLGGRTKTSIIATVSPGHKDLEETMSTLEYAHRAKNIQNKPEVNQKMTKKAILKEFAEEIDKLKRDLQAARDKNGVYLANETFAEMTLKQEEQRKEIQELLLRKRALEEERDRVEAMFGDAQLRLRQREGELSHTIDLLNDTKEQLATTCSKLQSTLTQFEEQGQLLEFQKRMEKELTAQAKQLLAVADQATGHLRYLHDAFDKRTSVEARNAQATREFVGACAARRERLADAAGRCAHALHAALASAAQALETHTEENKEMYEDSRNKLEELVKSATDAMNMLRETESKMTSDVSSNSLGLETHIRATLQTQSGHLHSALERSAEGVSGALRGAAALDPGQAVGTYLEEWRGEASAGLAGVGARAGAAAEGARRLGGWAADALHAHAAARTRHASAIEEAVRAHEQMMMEDKEYTEEELCELIAESERENAEADARLGELAEELWRVITRHMTREQRALAERHRARERRVERMRRGWEERASRARQRLQALAALATQEAQCADQELRRQREDVDAQLAALHQRALDCDGELNSVSSSVETMCSNVLSVVGEVRSQMVDALNNAAENIKKETESMTSSNRVVTEQLTRDLVSATSAWSQKCSRALDEMLRLADLNNTRTMEQISSLNSNTSELQSANEAHCSAQSQKLSAVQREMDSFCSGLTEELSGLEHLEEKYLKEEFKVYSPTGRTPARREYRYPRRLATASPRPVFAPQPHYEECVLVESEEEESEPPPPPPSAPPLLKCTSETDIYAKQRQERLGKENAGAGVARSASFKKPSRLPAPHQRRALNERN